MNKTIKLTVIGMIIVIFSLTFIGCDNGNGTTTHTHTWTWTETTALVETGTCSGCTETQTRSAIQAQMISIPGGSVYMENYWDSNDKYTATLSTFKMSKYAVTQAQYEAVMGENPSYFQGTGELPDGDEKQAKRPVEQVTWYDAVEFCNKLSVLENRTPVYTITDRYPATGYPITDATVTADFTKNGYRLPTEAQWEYACRAGSTGEYSTGKDGIEVMGENLKNYAWYGWENDWSTPGNSNEKTHEVGKLLPNAYGIYDMHGNVWEWCWDWYDDYPNENKTNYTGPDSGSSRVLRGGFWLNSAGDAASSDRYDSYAAGATALVSGLLAPEFCTSSEGLRSVVPPPASAGGEHGAQSPSVS